MRRFIAALALVGVSGAPAAGAELSVFYCYVPDVDSGVVYQSQALPVGPIAERSGYGREFADYLKASRRVRGELTGYCVMGASVGEIARAQAALSSEPCPECGAATRFESVVWPRARNAGVVARQDSTEASARHGPPPVVAVPHQTLLVVMGNAETGKLLVVSNAHDTKTVVAQAHMIRATGWKSLLETREPGFGAAFCVRHGGEVRFFLAHAQPSIKEAIAHAREYSRPYEAETGEPAKICGAPWRAQGDGLAPRDGDVIDELKDAIQEEFACDPSPKATDSGKGACPPRNMSGTGVRG